MEWWRARGRVGKLMAMVNELQTYERTSDQPETFFCFQLLAFQAHVRELVRPTLFLSSPLALSPAFWNLELESPGT